MIKALFFDIDGTLVSFKTHKVPNSTISAITEAHNKGIYVFISTGRPKAIINNLTELQSLNLIDGYITMNGAYCLIGNNIIYKSPIFRKEVEAIANFTQHINTASIYVSEHGISVNQPNEILKQIFYKNLHVDEIPVIPFEQLPSDQIYQITPFITIEQELQLHPHIPNCEIGRWHSAFADITAKGNTKKKGMDEIIKHFDFDLNETMSFGDGGNDESMLRHASIGVAMGQAEDHVKQTADYITTSVDNDGIYNAMKHFNII